MNFTGLHSQFAGMFAKEDDGPFWPARIVSQGAIVFDAGGSIDPSPLGAWLRECLVQIDAADTAMRAEQGFAEADRQMIIPAGTIEGPVTTDHQVEVRSGPFAGLWNIETVSLNSVASRWRVRGRKG
jgi:hypothetical protein